MLVSYWYDFAFSGNSESQFDLAMFILEYLLILVTFLLTLRAPGLPSVEERFIFHYGRLPESEQNLSTNAVSV